MVKRISVLFENKLRYSTDLDCYIRSSPGMRAALAHMQRMQMLILKDWEDEKGIDREVLKHVHDAARISFHFSSNNRDAITVSMCTFEKGKKNPSCIENRAFRVRDGQETGCI